MAGPCDLWKPFCLALYPDFVGQDAARAITDNLIFGDADLAGNRLNNAEQFGTNGVVVIALHTRGVNLIDESVLPVWGDHNSGSPRVALHRFVFEVDQPGRQKDKKQDEG